MSIFTRTSQYDLHKLCGLQICILEVQLLRGNEHYTTVCCLMNVAGKLYTVTPRITDLPAATAQLIVRSIAINSAYTSRVLVLYIVFS